MLTPEMSICTGAPLAGRRLLLFGFRLLFALGAAGKVGEVRGAVLELHQMGGQPVEAHLIDDDALGQQRHQRDEHLSRLHAGEVLLAVALGQRHPADLRADLGKQLELDVAVDRQRAAGLVLDLLDDLRLVLVGIEGRT